MEQLRVLRIEERLVPDDQAPDSMFCTSCRHDYRTIERSDVKGVECPTCGDRGKIGRRTLRSDEAVPDDWVEAGVALSEPDEVARMLAYGLIVGQSLLDESERWTTTRGSRAKTAAAWRIVSSLRQVIRVGELVAASFKSSTLRDRLAELRAGHPDLINVRDALEHWDAYLKGEGRLQETGAGAWVLEGLDISPDEDIVVLGPYRLELRAVVAECYEALEHAVRVLSNVLEIQGGFEGRGLPNLAGHFARA